MDYAVHTAPREHLIAELTQSAADRREHGKHERADEAEAAARQLAEGAEVSYFERTYYEVGEAKRRGVIRRRRDDLIAELHDAAEGWAHHGKALLAFEARAAAGRIAYDSVSERVGHLVYEVLGDVLPEGPSGVQ